MNDQLSDLNGYRTVADLAYAQLRDRILSGELAPGARIDQDAEADRLVASRMPVREALRRLESEGLVEIVRHRGALVRSLSVSDLEDLYVLRIALEGVASRLGTERLTNESLDQMQALLPEMTAIVERRDAPAWLAIDLEFHSILYAGCGHPRLLAMIRALREEAGRYRLLGIRQPKEFERSLESHHTILAAAAQRDSAEVERVIQAELVRSRERMRRMLEERQLATEAKAQEGPEEGSHGRRRSSRQRS